MDVSFDEERVSEEFIETAEWHALTPPREDGRDTVRDATPTSDVRELMEAIARGEPVEKTQLVRELERMLRLVARTDADFEALCVMVRRTTRLRADHDCVELRTLPDGSAIIYTPWPVSSRPTIEAELAEAKPVWLAEHDDPRGVPCFRASSLDIASAALSYDDALYLLGREASFLDT
jgi:hypothetical protein